MCLTRSEVAAFCRFHGLDAIYVFGSRAGEVAAAVRDAAVLDPAAASDVDIGVLPAPAVRFEARDRAQLMMALEDLLGGARVDLVLLPEAPAFLALDIVCGELLAATDKDRVAEYELYVLRRAGDLAPFERERRRLILSGEAR